MRLSHYSSSLYLPAPCLPPCILLQDSVAVCAAVIRYHLRDRPRTGVCTTFLQDRVAVGEICPVFISHNPDFRLPSDGEVPIIMIGPGTGLAPFRAFIQERGMWIISCILVYKLSSTQCQHCSQTCPQVLFCGQGGKLVLEDTNILISLTLTKPCSHCSQRDLVLLQRKSWNPGGGHRMVQLNPCVLGFISSFMIINMQM